MSQSVSDLQKKLPRLIVTNLKSAIVQLELAIRDKSYGLEDLLQPLAVENPSFEKTPKMTLLEYAAQIGQWDFIIGMLKGVPNIFLEQGHQITDAQRRKIDEVRSFCLVAAVMQEQEEVVDVLLDQNPNLELVRIAAEGYMPAGPLDWAVYRASKALVRKLLDAGADPLQVMPRNYYSPLEAAVTLGKNDERYWSLVPLLARELAEDERAVRAYSKALVCAAAAGQTEIVIHLLSVGADPNLMSVLGDGPLAGSTALHFACRNDDRTMAFYLLAAGADPAVTNKAGISFEQLVTKDKSLSKLSIYSPTERIEVASKTLMHFREDYPIRKPALPTRIGRIIAIYAVSALLAELTIKICALLGIVSAKDRAHLSEAKNAANILPHDSPAADRFFQSRVCAPTNSQEPQRNSTTDSILSC